MKNCNSELETFKARLIIKGFTQKKRIDYDKTFSLVVRYSLYSMTIIIDLDMDVATGFLQSELDKEIYKYIHGIFKRFQRCFC